MDEVKILNYRDVFTNRWVRLQEKTVAFPWLARPEEYYTLVVPNYVCILAFTDDGRIPLVRQYRPAVEAFTWEFPSGTCEINEDTEATARRELAEETGLSCRDLQPLGKYHTDVGRLNNFLYGYLATGLSWVANYQPEPGVEMKLVTQPELGAMIQDGQFNFALHLCIWATYKSSPFATDQRPGP